MAGEMNISRVGRTPTPSPLQSAYTNYGKSVIGQGNDYNDIMGRYKDTYNDIATASRNTSSLPVPGYQNTPDYTRAVGNLKSASDKGLYSDEDQSNLRERGISPVRAVYANAQRGLNRQRSLQGGYSPNYAAVSAKMARDMSSQLSDRTTAVNAQIAQDIASQRANAQSQYASTSSHEQDERNAYGLQAFDRQIQNYNLPVNQKLATAQGMTNLYGTTPAWASLMQGGALNQGQLESNVNQNNANNQTRLMQIYGGA